jgi:hypothetical protein
MTARPGGNACPDTGIEADFAPTAHSDFARQTCNKPLGLALRRNEFCSYPAGQ